MKFVNSDLAPYLSLLSMKFNVCWKRLIQTVRFVSLQVFINFAKNQTDGMGEDALSAEVDEPTPYNDEEAGPRVSFVRMSDFTPGSVDV